MKRLLTTAAVAAALACGTASAAESDYAGVEVPGTIRVIVAYSAGGSSDTLARVTMPVFERHLEELSGQETNAVIVNLPGAGGEIGWTALANADPDGSTIGIINLPAVPLVEKARDPGYAPWMESFTPLGVNVIDPNVIRVGKDSDYDTLKDAIEAAKQNPGSVTIGADGPLSDDHLASYIIAQATGAEFSFVPYPGGAPANRAFRSNEVDLAVGNVFDHLQTEEAAADAATFRDAPYDMIPEVGTVDDKLGIDARNTGSTRGFAAPAGVPEDLLKLYRAAFEAAFNDAEYQKQARERSITLVEPRIGEAFGQIMQDQEDAVSELLTYFVEGGYIEK